MIGKTIEYVDYDGMTQKDTFYFNLNKAELLEMEASRIGGMSKLLRNIAESTKTDQIIPIFKEILCRAIGEKSLDGKRFVKNQEVTDRFLQSEAYNVFFQELLETPGAAASFIKGVMPAEISAEDPKTPTNVTPMA